MTSPPPMPTPSLASPPVVTVLGYGGLMPFIVLAAARVIVRHATIFGGNAPTIAATSPLAGTALLTYGGVILSFVGALHWGFAMTLADLSERRRRQLYVWSVIPALIAWIALLLAPPVAALALTAGFVVQYLQDRRLSRETALPSWFMRLRLRLTLGASVSVLIGVFV